MIDSIRNEEWKDYSQLSAAEQQWIKSYRSGRCHVHGTTMLRRWIPVRYNNELYLTGKVKMLSEFPFAACQLSSSLVILTPEGKPIDQEAEIFMCRECDRAFEEWLRNRERANKAPEPTSRSVTPRAIVPKIEMKRRIPNCPVARVAPARAVAHL